MSLKKSEKYSIISKKETKIMEKFFTDCFSNMPQEEIENYHRAVFMNMEGGYSAEKRVEYYREKLKHIGNNVYIGCRVIIKNPQWITLMDDVYISDGCVLIATSESGIVLEQGVRLKYGVYLDGEGSEGYIHIGKNVYIGTGTCLHGHKGLEIGDNCLLAQNITITPYSHRFDDPEKPIYTQGGFSKKLTIGNDCYIGKNACILYRADIGNGSVVGAGSVVVKPVEPYSVVAGNPAKLIRKRKPCA